MYIEDEPACKLNAWSVRGRHGDWSPTTVPVDLAFDLLLVDFLNAVRVGEGAGFTLTNFFETESSEVSESEHVTVLHSQAANWQPRRCALTLQAPIRGMIFRWLPFSRAHGPSVCVFAEHGRPGRDSGRPY